MRRREAPARPAFATCSATVKSCSRRFHRAGPGHDDHLVAADLHPVGKFDDRSLRTKAAPRQFVGRADAVNVLHPGQHFEIASVEVHARAHRGQHGLALAGGAVHGEAHPDQVFDHLLDLLFGCRSCIATIISKSSVVGLQSSANPVSSLTTDS